MIEVWIRELSKIEVILLATFMLMCFVQLLYYWLIYSKLLSHKENKTANQRPVSVVIAARNEFSNLQKNLPVILQQDYPNFEVVVVNNYSDDDSEYLLRELSEEYSNLNVISIKENVNFFKGKKFPLSIGIKSAKYEHVLLTDADCRPSSLDWISQMQSGFNNDHQIVLGYGKYEKEKGLLNQLIRFDALQIGMQYLSYALRGIPYMGVGRNLAYTKPLFHGEQGFSSHYHILSGDDDLFINKVANKKNTNICVNPDAYTISKAETSFSNWWKQKKRHNTTGKYYKKLHQFLLVTFEFSKYMFYLLAIALLCIKTFWLPIVIIFSIRLFTQLFVTGKCMKKLHEKDFLFLVPIFEIFLLFVTPTFYIANIFKKSNKWN